MGTESASATGEGVLAAAPDDTQAVAGVLGVRALGLARLASLPAGIALGLRSADIALEVALLNSLFAAVWVLATNRTLLRRGLGRRATLLVAGVDVAIVVIGITATGGVRSDMCLLLGVLPLASAFEFRARIVAGIGLAGAILLVATGTDEPVALGTALTVLAWSTAAGLALAADRRVFFSRVRGLAQTRERLLRAHEDVETREQARVVDELRLGALADVREALEALSAPDGGAQAADRCRDALVRVRGLVSELHALSARPVALRSAVLALARRRAVEGSWVLDVEVDELAGGERDELVLVVVRDLLDALAFDVAEPSVLVQVHERDGRVHLRVAIDGDAGAFSPLGIARLRERLSGVRGAALEVGPGRVTATFGQAAPPAARSRRQPETVRTILTARLLGAFAVLALAGIGGATSAAFWVPALAGIVIVIGTSARQVRRPYGPRGLLLSGIVDQATVLVALALVGPAQDELLFLLVGLVPIYACVYRPRTVFAMVGSLGVGATAVVGYEPAFLIAYAWAGAVAYVLAAAADQARRVISEQLRRRRAAFLSLLASEEAVRRLVARRLHDDALQLLLAARQDAEEAVQPGPPGEDARRRAARALQEVQDQLSGASLAGDVDAAPANGLVCALDELVRGLGRDSGLAVEQLVDPTAAGGRHDGLLLGLAREFLTNVAQHAGAGSARLVLRRDPAGGVALEVLDDGAGIPAGREERALAEGHIGLAAARDRVARRGGTLHVGPVPGGTGTRVTAALPPG